MVWVVDLSASYLDLFELLKEEMPSETAIMRVSRENSNFAFNPFLLKDPRQPEIPEEQFEFCLGFLKLMAGPELCSPTNEMVMRKGLKEFFNGYRVLLRNQKAFKPIPPLNLLASNIDMEGRHSDLSAAINLWTTGRRGELFNTGRDTLQNARYCYFDLRDLEGEAELTTAIVYVIFSKVYRDIADENLRAVQKRFILDEAHRYISDPAFSFWIQLIARTGRHWNIMLDLITQSINDLQSNAILTNLKQAFMFPGQKNIEESFQKLQLTDYHIEQYKKLDPAKYEVLYWSDGGLRRILRSVADPYTYWLATTDAEERAMKRRMKGRFSNVRSAIEELVRVTNDCQSTKDRISKLNAYFEEAA
jgi:type IV secretory pathway VirB4 component